MGPVFSLPAPSPASHRLMTIPSAPSGTIMAGVGVVTDCPVSRCLVIAAPYGGACRVSHHPLQARAGCGRGGRRRGLYVVLRSKKCCCSSSGSLLQRMPRVRSVCACFVGGVGWGEFICDWWSFLCVSHAGSLGSARLLLLSLCTAVVTFARRGARAVNSAHCRWLVAWAFRECTCEIFHAVV